MPLVIAWFVKNWVAVAIAGFLAFALGYVEVQHLRIAHLKSQVVSLQADAKTYQASLKTVEDALTGQNAKLHAWATENRTTQAKATAAITHAQASRPNVSAAIAKIEALPAGPDVLLNLEQLRKAYEK